jgi:RND family efflux transporter MFP subunit
MKSNGTIERMFVEAGDRVKKGQILASLEKKNFQLGLDQANSLEKAAASHVAAANAAIAAAATGIQLAEVKLQTISRDYERAKGLRAKDTIPQQQFDQIEGQYKLAQVGLDAAKDQLVQAKAGLAVAQAQMNVAQVGVRSAQQQNDDATLIAPFDGLIVEKLVQENEPCDNKTLYQLVDDTVMELTVRLPERFLPFINLDSKMVVRTPLLPKPVLASVSAIISSIDQSSLSFEVKAIIPNQEYKISHGGYADVDVVIKEECNVPVIPTNIVKITGDSVGQASARSGYVFTVNDGKAQKIPVTLGITQNNHISVISGLACETKIINHGFGQVENGTLVTVTSETSR